MFFFQSKLANDISQKIWGTKKKNNMEALQKKKGRSGAKFFYYS